MAKVFRKKTTVWRLEGRKVPADTPGATKETIASRKWYGYVPQKNGKRKAVALCTDKQKSQQMLNKMLTDVAMGKHGMNDSFQHHRSTTLHQHLEAWQADLSAKGRTDKHSSLSASRVRTIIEECDWVWLSDLSASGVQSFIGELRKRQKSASTRNHYLTAVKMFSRWLVKDRRIQDDPLAYLSKENENLDKRHERRDLSVEELAFILCAAREGDTMWKLSGESRAMLYLVAIYTGLRASELASLTPASFSFSQEQATVTVDAAYSKHRRKDVLPIHAEIKDEVASWIVSRPPEKPLWPGSWARCFKGAKMLRADMKNARSAWLEEAESTQDREEREKSNFLIPKTPDGKIVDFHALRHTFISHLTRGGLMPKVAQILARHSTITLTMDRYTHVDQKEVAEAMNTLPSFVGPRDPSPGESVSVGDPVCTLFAQTPATRGHQETSCDNGKGIQCNQFEKSQVFTMERLGTCCHREVPTKEERRRPDSNRGIADLQSAALPLGHAAF